MSAHDSIHDSILTTIGHTPLVRLHKSVPKNEHTFLGKVEFMNPGSSVKDRIALSIVDDAEKSGKLRPGGTIVEATSGNTGVGLAMVAALRGYKCIFVMPEKISEEKRATLRAYGARVVITPNGVEPEDPRSHYSVAAKFVEMIPGAYLTNQYHNPANVKAHFEVTGPEIWEQTKGKIDVFVGGAGTGGTLSGVGRYLKSKNPDIKIVCADPIGSILHDLFYYKEARTKPSTYLVEGIGEDMLPDNVHLDVMDDFVQVNDRESFAMTRLVARTEGILIGPSCGAALVAAVRYSQSGQLKKPSTIVTLFPDSGRNYLSKAFDDTWMREKGLLAERLADFQVAHLVKAKLDSKSLLDSTSRVSVALQSSVREAVRTAHGLGVTNLFVFDGSRFAGTLDLSDVLNALASGRVRGDESVLHLVRAGGVDVKHETSLTELREIFKRTAWVRVHDGHADAHAPDAQARDAQASNMILTESDLIAFTSELDEQETK